MQPLTQWHQSCMLFPPTCIVQVSCVCVNSTAIIGLVLLQSIFGQAGSSLSQLGAVLLFLFQCPMVELAYKHHTPAACQGSKFPHESR